MSTTSKLSLTNTSCSNMSSFEFLKLPRELQEHILGFLDLDTLLNCRQTCKQFSQILNPARFWRKILHQRIGLGILTQFGLTPNIHLEWKWSFLLAKHESLGKNLLKSPELLSSWKVLFPVNGGWTTENPPINVEKIPEEVGVTSCLSVNFVYSTKEQVVDLWKCGFHPGFLDKLQPKIIYGEWINNSFQNYYLTIKLLNSEFDFIMEDRYTNQGRERSWKNIHKELNNYGPGLRYITFFHEGSGTGYRTNDGNYLYDGSKITGSYLKLTL